MPCDSEEYADRGIPLPELGLPIRSRQWGLWKNKGWSIDEWDFEENDQGYYVFNSDAEIDPMIERMLELEYVRPDKYIKEYRIGKRCKDTPSAAPSEVP